MRLRLLLINMSPPSGAACFRGNGAAGSAAKLPGGPVGELRSFGDVGAAPKGRQPHHGLPVCTGGRLGKHKETFLKESTSAATVDTPRSEEVSGITIPRDHNQDADAS